MESRKIVLINLFAGKEWRHRHRELICGHSGGERVGRIERVALIYTHSVSKLESSGRPLYSTGGSARCSVMT